MGKLYNDTQKLVIHEIAHHRNGISGVPFNIIKFHDATPGEDHEMMAIMFDQEEYAKSLKKGEFTNPYCAVLDTDLLAKGVIAFMQNSWRGDDYSEALSAAITKHEKKERRKFLKQMRQKLPWHP